MQKYNRLTFSFMLTSISLLSIPIIKAEKAEAEKKAPKVVKLKKIEATNLQQDTPQTEVAALIESIQRGSNGLINIANTTQFISLLVSKQGKHAAVGEALRMLRDFKQYVDSLLNEQANLILIQDLETLQEFANKTIQCSKALYKYLDDIIASGLTEFKDFDGQNIFQKIMASDKKLPLQTLHKELIAFEKKTVNLQIDAEKATLTWYNIAARGLENYIFLPIQKYNLVSGAKITAASGFVSVYILWCIASEYYREQYNAYKIEQRKNMPSFNRMLANTPRELIHQHAAQLLLNGDKKHDPSSGLVTTELIEDDSSWNGDGNRSIDKSAAHVKAILDKKEKLEHEEEVINRQAYMEKHVPAPLRKLFDAIGMPLVLNPQTGVIDQTEIQKNPHLYGIISHINGFLQTIMMRANPITTYAGSYALKAIYSWYWGDAEEQTPGFELYLNKKRTQMWNFLRGGAYSEQASPFEFIPKVTFDDVIGMDELKEEFEVLIEFVLNSEMFINTGKTPERGYLLTGPTRTGKSYFIEALFGEILKRAAMRKKDNAMRFRKIYSYDLKQHGSIELILLKAKMFAPIMLWFDEVDLLQLQRGVGDNKNLQDFLTGMGNTFDNDPRRLVIIVATTNKPENMDKPLRQHGRFGKEIRFEYPPARYRRQYLIAELAKMAINPNLFDIETLVQKTAGKSFEELRALIKGATIAAWIRKVPFSQELLEEIIDIELRHIIMLDRKELPEKEKEILALHMAAQALAHFLLSQGSDRLDKVTIKAVMVSLKDEHVWQAYFEDDHKTNDEKKIQYGSIFTKSLYDTANIQSFDDIMNQVKVLLAGFAAEEMIFGMSTFKFHESDSAQAFKILEGLVLQGLDKKGLSEAQKSIFTQEIFDMRKKLMAEVKTLLEEHKIALEEIAQALKERSTLTSSEIEAIIDNTEESGVA